MKAVVHRKDERADHAYHIPVAVQGQGEPNRAGSSSRGIAGPRPRIASATTGADAGPVEMPHGPRRRGGAATRGRRRGAGRDAPRSVTGADPEPTTAGHASDEGPSVRAQ